MPDDPKSLLDRIFSSNSLDLISKATPIIFLLIVIVILGIQIGTFEGNSNILRDLSDPAVARGLITLLFTIATVWVAMVITLAAVSKDGDDDKFNRGKDVLTILVGILGTIIGYYFGAETQQKINQTSPSDEVEIIPEERQLPNNTDQS